MERYKEGPYFLNFLEIWPFLLPFHTFPIRSIVMEIQSFFPVLLQGDFLPVESNPTMRSRELLLFTLKVWTSSDRSGPPLEVVQFFVDRFPF